MDIKKIIVGQLQTNCYLLIDGGELAAVDPGDEAPRIIAEIGKTGAAVKYIINTHCHFDHIGANAALENEFGVKASANLKEGDVLAIGKSQVSVVKTPGHTPEGICLFGAGFVISGDTLFDGGIGRTDLAGGSNKEMAASLKKLDDLIPEGAMVYPGHGDIFTYEKGAALRWIRYLE
jgi:glyoxylase-like metal-dependent hydrolase (beta-lactamase superfamily II)